jgi:hypothetical protein
MALLRVSVFEADARAATVFRNELDTDSLEGLA